MLLKLSRRYTTVPSNLKDKEVFPNFSDIPSIITTIRHPRRRAISVGPQSEADAYETLAYREKRRRESQSSGNRESQADGEHKQNGTPNLSRKTSKLNQYENMMGTGSPQSGKVELDSDIVRSSPLPPPQYETTRTEEKEVFSQIKKPRVRYDVEVVTKLVVYFGMFGSSNIVISRLLIVRMKVSRGWSSTLRHLFFRCLGLESLHSRVVS